MSNRDFKEMLRYAIGNFLGLAFAIAFYFLLLRLTSVIKGVGSIFQILTPFVYGGIMAFILKTPCNFFEKLYKAYLPEPLKKRKSGLAIITVLILVFFSIYTLMSIVVPQVIASIGTLTRSVPVMTRRFFDWLSNYLNGDGVVQNYIRPIVERFTAEAVEWANGDVLPQLKQLQELQGMVGDVTSTLSSIVGALMNLLIGLIVCIYTLLARKTFARQAKAVVYSIFKTDLADKVIEEVHFINATFDGFISGKVMDSAVVALICYAFCMILSFTRGFSNSVLISLIIGVTNIIPYFGPFIGAVPAVLLIAISDPINALIFIIFIMFLQSFDGNVLGPKLLAGSVGLSGFWVLFSITLFSGLFGFAGVLVGVPIFAVIYDLLRKAIVKGLEKNGRLDILEKGIDEVKKKPEPKKKVGWVEKRLNERIEKTASKKDEKTK